MDAATVRLPPNSPSRAWRRSRRPVQGIDDLDVGRLEKSLGAAPSARADTACSWVGTASPAIGFILVTRSSGSGPRAWARLRHHVDEATTPPRSRPSRPRSPFRPRDAPQTRHRRRAGLSGNHNADPRSTRRPDRYRPNIRHHGDGGPLRRDVRLALATATGRPKHYRGTWQCGPDRQGPRDPREAGTTRVGHIMLVDIPLLHIDFGPRLAHHANGKLFYRFIV